MELLIKGEYVPVVVCDGADNTPVEEFEKYNPGQLLARILYADKDARLEICAQMLNNADVAIRCEAMNHEDELKHLREHQMRMSIERQQMYQIITWLSMYKALADSLTGYADRINGESGDEYTRDNMKAKISGWATMAKTTQARLSEIQEASSDGGNPDGNAGSSNAPSKN